MFDPMGPPGQAAGATLRDAEAWRAVAAALRQVAPSLRVVAARDLDQPSWRPGERVEDAAYAEGRKQVWRMLLAAMEEGR